MSSDKVSIFWFRRDLRLHDNHGLYEALKSGDTVLPIFIFDINILDALKDKADKRVDFIHRALSDIQDELQKHGASLYVLHGTPPQAFERLLHEYTIAAVYTNHDYEPYALQRDEAIRTLLGEHNISLYTYKDQVIFEKDEVTKSDGKPYTIYTPYSRVWKQHYSSGTKAQFPSEKLHNHFYKGNVPPMLSLREIGFEKTDIEIPPAIPDESIVRQYDETRNLPYINGTSRMSVHLRFGTVSVRELAVFASKYNEQYLNELIWREFFMMVLYHFPRVVTTSYKEKYDYIEWRNNEAEFKHWCEGKTGYPLVDAGMRELNETGFMHNRVRMVVASFLTKHLLIDWRWGEAYFADKLIDYELSSNNGNWQWAAGCGCDAAPYFRIFNPTEQQKKFDPDFIYIKKWVKEYKQGYLDPIVDHDFARKRCLDVFKKAVADAS